MAKAAPPNRPSPRKTLRAPEKKPKKARRSTKVIGELAKRREKERALRASRELNGRDTLSGKLGRHFSRSARRVGPAKSSMNKLRSRTIRRESRRGGGARKTSRDDIRRFLGQSVRRAFDGFFGKKQSSLLSKNNVNSLSEGMKARRRRGGLAPGDVGLKFKQKKRKVGSGSTFGEGISE